MTAPQIPPGEEDLNQNCTAKALMSAPAEGIPLGRAFPTTSQRMGKHPALQIPLLQEGDTVLTLSPHIPQPMLQHSNT